MKTALITGASRGIGREIARQFALEQYSVVLHYNQSEEKALELLREIRGYGATAIAVKADLSKSEEIDAMFQTIFSQFSSIDVLINNAAIAEQKLFSDISEDDWQRIFDINVKSGFLCSQKVLPGMLRKKRGKIINLTSVWGITGASCEVHYSAAKAAVIGFTKALAKELGPSGIHVNCVAPGVIDTDMNANLTPETMQNLKDETPLERIGTPLDVANTVMFLASDKADFITGQVISPNGGIQI